MVQDNTWFESSDGTKLYLRRWKPEESGVPLASPSAVLHIVHGMAEHSGRYGRLAEKLCAAGIEVWAADQRGHGKTADLSINSPGRGGSLGHCTDSGTFQRVTADVNALNREIRKLHPGIPLFLMGHSWGSFIVQNYIEGKSDDIDGCILSSTRGPDGFKVKAGRVLLAIVAFFCGRRRRLDVTRITADIPYNRPFRPNRTPFDWLSRDEAEVDGFINDPLCFELFSAGFYRDLVGGLYRIHRGRLASRIRRNLPVYIFSGSADPVGEMGASPTALVTLYRSLGIEDMEFVLYPGARHETLNETNRDEVMSNLLSWINRHTAGATASGQPAPGREG